MNVPQGPTPDQRSIIRRAAIDLAEVAAQLGLRLCGYRLALVDDPLGQTRPALIADFALTAPTQQTEGH